jgi:thiol-disulfide isomerase/thioredoxin
MILSFTLPAQAEDGTKSIDEIFFAQRQNFMRVKSISMTYSENWQTSEYVNNQPDPLTYPKTFKVAVDIENDKFRIDDVVEGAKIHPKQEKDWIFEITAFDLNKYQTFIKSIAHLMVRTKTINPLHCMNYPLARAYAFVYNLRSHDDCTLEDFHSKELWEGLKERTQFIDDSTVEGYDCIATEISFPGKSRFARVYWAKGFQYYPVNYELFDMNGKKLSEHTVKGLSKYDTVEGPVVIPMLSMHTEWHPVDEHKLYTITQTIDSNSLSINEDISDEIFTIPLSMAKSIYDDRDPWGYSDPNTILMKGKVPPEFTLAKLGGGKVSLSREKDKVVVLDFWTTWCGPCIVALPGLERVQKWATENELPVAFYCINVKEKPEKVAVFCKKHKMSIPVLMDEDGAVRKAYKVPGYPTMIIITDRMIKHIHVGGYAEKERLLLQERQLKEEIKSLLAESRSKQKS